MRKRYQPYTIGFTFDNDSSTYSRHVVDLVNMTADRWEFQSEYFSDYAHIEYCYFVKEEVLRGQLLSELFKDS